MSHSRTLLDFVFDTMILPLRGIVVIPYLRPNRPVRHERFSTWRSAVSMHPTLQSGRVYAGGNLFCCHFALARRDV